MSTEKDRKVATKQFPGEYTMFVDDSPMRFMHADSCAELDSNFKMKDGHTSTKVHNRYLIDAFILGIQHARQGERAMLIKFITWVRNHYAVNAAIDDKGMVDFYLDQEESK